MLKQLTTKEIKENIFSMKAILWLLGVSVIFSGMSISFISVKELGLMAQSEILVTMTKIIIAVALLIAIILSSVSLSNEREQATLESLLLSPVKHKDIIFSKTLAILVIWGFIYLVAVPYIIVLGYGTTLIPTTLLLVFTLGTVIVLIFSMISISLSIVIRSSKNSMILSILMFIILATPLFLSTTMKKSGFGKVLDGVSPISNILNMTKEVLIRHIGFIDMLTYLIPLVVVLAVVFGALVYSTKKLSFEGVE